MIKRASAAAAKMGGSMTIAEPGNYEIFNKQVKILIEAFGEVVRKAKKSNANAATYYKQLDLVVKCSHEIESLVVRSQTSNETVTTPLTPLLQSLAHRSELLLKYHNGCLKQSHKLVILPVLNIVNTILKPARAAKKEADKAKVQAELLDTRLKNYLAKGKDMLEPQQLLSHQHDYYLALSKYRALFDKSYEAVNIARSMGMQELIQSITSYHQWRQREISQIARQCPPNADQLLSIFNEYRVYMTQQGLELSQRQLALKQEEEDHRYDKLLSLLSSNQLNVISAVAFSMKGERKDEILQSLIKTLDAFNRTLPIIKHGIVDEVKSTKDASTMFRTNSMSTKLISAFTRLTGRPLLIRNFQELVAKICKSPLIYEVDPKKCKDGYNAEDNMENLYSICNECIETIIDNVDYMPIPFCYISRCLFDQVELRFPGSGYKAVGGFLFLRFMCPAIMAPDANKVTDQKISGEARRALTLVSKVIQNLSNSIMFGKKEMYLEAMNPFLEKHASTIRNFFKDVIEDQQPDASLVKYEPLATVHQAKHELLPELFEAMIGAADIMSKKLIDLQATNEVLPLAQLLGQLREKKG